MPTPTIRTHTTAQTPPQTLNVVTVPTDGDNALNTQTAAVAVKVAA